MSRRVVLSLLLSLLLAACAGPAIVPAGETATAGPGNVATAPLGSPTKSGAPSPTRLPSPAPTPSPGPDATFDASPTPVVPAGCPTSSPVRVSDYVAADPSCFPGDTAVVGWLGGLPSIGFEAPYIQPGWLAYPPAEMLSAMWQRGPGGDAMCGDTENDCSWFVLHRRPASGLDFGSRARWVIAIGHRDDPAAERCHFVFDTAWPAETPAQSYAQERCRESFVVVSLVTAQSPPSP